MKSFVENGVLVEEFLSPQSPTVSNAHQCIMVRMTRVDSLDRVQAPALIRESAEGSSAHNAYKYLASKCFIQAAVAVDRQDKTVAGAWGDMAQLALKNT